MTVVKASQRKISHSFVKILHPVNLFKYVQCQAAGVCMFSKFKRPLKLLAITGKP